MDDTETVPRPKGELWLRIGIIAIGVAGVLYGARLLFSRPSLNQPVHVIIWAVASDVVIDGMVIPLTLLVGWVLTKTVRPRARRYAQGALIAIAAVVPIALIEIVAKNGSYVPFIRSANPQNPAKALLTQDYTANLLIVAGIVAAVGAAAYALRVILDRRSAITHMQPETKPQ
jgi:hypothetical protein